MALKLITTFRDYHPWSGAVDTYDKIYNADKLHALEDLLEDYFPAGVTSTQLNDILWFDSDNILQALGIPTDEDDEDAETNENYLNI
jgi:hypothetical protein